MLHDTHIDLGMHGSDAPRTRRVEGSQPGALSTPGCTVAQGGLRTNKSSHSRKADLS